MQLRCCRVGRRSSLRHTRVCSAVLKDIQFTRRCFWRKTRYVSRIFFVFVAYCLWLTDLAYCVVNQHPRCIRYLEAKDTCSREPSTDFRDDSSFLRIVARRFLSVALLDLAPVSRIP